MKIALTGSTGFVGRNLTTYFENEGHEIVPLKVRYEESDTFDFSGLAVDAIVHAAGIAHDLKGKFAESEYEIHNTELTARLVASFIKSDIPDFFFISSIKAVADSSENVINEATPQHPTTAYGKSKFNAEQFIRSIRIPEGKRIFILQPTLMYGKGSKGNFRSMLTFVRWGLPYPLGAFTNRRSFLNVNNLAFVIASLMQRTDIAGGRFILSDDEEWSTVQLLRLIARMGDRHLITLSISPKIVRFFVKFADICRLPLNSRWLAKLTENYYVDNSKIKTVLDLEKMPYDMEAGLFEIFAEKG